MFTGMLSLEILLGDVRSLKQKRAVVRPIIAEIQRRYSVSVAEVGQQDLHRRAEIGVAVVAGEAGQCHRLLDAIERSVADRPEVDLLSARRRLFALDD